LTEEVGQIQDDNIRKKMNRYINKRVSSIYEAYSKNPDYNFNRTRQKFGFLDNNISLEKIASYINRKSKMTSRRWLDKAKKKNLLSIQPREIYLQDIEPSFDIKSFRKYSDRFPIIKGKKLFIRIPLNVILL
jgi:hypothetical protein